LFLKHNERVSKWLYLVISDFGMNVDLEVVLIVRFIVFGTDVL